MYKTVFRDIAAAEYADAIEWYEKRSQPAAETFIAAINEKLSRISSNPKQYKSIFKNYYEVSTSRYPFIIVYFIEEKLQQVIIVAIYHHKRRPRKKYRK